MRTGIVMVGFALAACGSTPKRDCMDCGGPMVQPHETSCIAGDTSLVCPEGLVDGCAAGLTNNKVCVAADAVAGLPCAEPSELACTEPASDGCFNNFASTHVCITWGTWK